MTDKQPHHNRNIKVDDEDGHYIVVPEADLTDKCNHSLFHSDCTDQ